MVRETRCAASSQGSQCSAGSGASDGVGDFTLTYRWAMLAHYPGQTTYRSGHHGVLAPDAPHTREALSGAA